MLPGSCRHRLCRQTDRWDQYRTKKDTGKRYKHLSHNHRYGAGTMGVWGLEPRFAQVLSPIFLDALALTLHHAVRRRCRRRSKVDPVVHWPGSSFGRAAPQCSRAPHRDLTSLTARGATGGHCKNHRKNFSDLLTPPSLRARFPNSILLPNSSPLLLTYHCIPRKRFALLEILIVRKISC